MTLPGMSRPMRTGGIALLCVAAVAAAIGTASAISSDVEPMGTVVDGRTTTPTDSGDATPTTTEETDLPDGEPDATSPANGDDDGDNGENGENGGNGDGPGQTDPNGNGSSTADDPSADGAPGQPVDGEKQAASVRVYNNSHVQNLAARAAEDLRASGWNVVATGNYSSGTIYRTTVYYREGTSEETAATMLGEEFGFRVEPRFEGIADATPGLIVIVTKDYADA